MNSTSREKILQHKVLDMFLVAVLLALIAVMMVFLFDDRAVSVEQEQSQEDIGSEQYVQYNLTSQGVFPYSHEVDVSEEDVYLENQRSETLVVSFDREDIGDVNLEPGDREQVETDRIAYFEVNNSEGRVGRGKINVQQ